MNKCTIYWNRDDMILNFQEIKYNIDLSTYLKDTYYECSKRQASDEVFLFYILEHLQKIATEQDFLKGFNGNSILNIAFKTANIKTIDLNQYSPWSGGIDFQEFSINLHIFFEIVYDGFRKYRYTSPTTEPKIILVGQNLKTAIVRGRLPDQRVTFHYKGLPRVIYVPEMEDTVVLGEQEIE